MAADPESYEPYGMCLQAGQLWVYKSDDEARRAVRMMAQAGVQWIRFGAAWGLSNRSRVR